MKLNLGTVIKFSILGFVILVLVLTGCFAIFKGVTLKNPNHFGRDGHHVEFKHSMHDNSFYKAK
ncbi:MAG TPA: hypothetical protein VN426_12985 [Syntrophomonadaceae bacterium]|nr:hypothetical protein [Syntrophomonadaceae bacterium]